ncbi:hypothetical protein POTOM_045668 [Populus tomentosa]|uniref:Uncharacterized protein n=1 Tax=Populus tomentosa TaxID=118781 RepID=A0A8X8CFF4_POPTO|nr:hypothetical protein POTOM_045668 [Populus tomentosa]
MGSYLSSFFIEAHNALLQFLGLVIGDHQIKTQEGSSPSSPEKQEDEKASEESSQDPPPTTTDPEADPPTDNSVISLSLTLSLSLSQLEDPPAVTVSALARRAPPVSSGSGGQINSTSA